MEIETLSQEIKNKGFISNIPSPVRNTNIYFPESGPFDPEMENELLKSVKLGDTDDDDDDDDYRGTPLFFLDKEAAATGTDSMVNIDTDRDGLSDDYELNVLKTDPNNPDTDGDGYTDGEEVEKNYNPLGPG